MTFAVVWLAFPVVLGLVCFGCGLLLEEVTRRRLPVLLLMPMGFAAVIVVVQLATISDADAELGLAGGGRSGSGRLRAVLSMGAHRSMGGPRAAACLRRLRSAGRALGRSDVHRLHQARRYRDVVRPHRSGDGPRPQPRRTGASSYEATLAFNLGDGYPIGVFLPLGVGRDLTGRDVGVGLPAVPGVRRRDARLRLYVLAGTVLRSGPARMLAAVVAAQPALLFGYALWGGIKEIVGAALIALLATLVALACRGGGTARPGARLSLSPVRPVIAVLLASVGPCGCWSIPGCPPRCSSRDGAGRSQRFAVAALVAIVAGALSAPLIAAEALVPPTSSPRDQRHGEGQPGGAAQPAAGLRGLAGGRLPFRAGRHARHHVLVGVVALAAVPGLVWAWRRRATGSAAVRGRTAAAGAAIAPSGRRGSTPRRSPRPRRRSCSRRWSGPACWRRAGGGSRAPSWRCWSAAGVLWSNVLAYNEVNLAPHDRHRSSSRSATGSPARDPR